MGAAGTVTGSAYVLALDGHEILVDCGVFQGEVDAAERNAQAPVPDPSELGAVVLTHGHLDHVGRLPLLSRGGFAGPIFGHPATLAIAEIVLRDALKISQFAGAGVYSTDDVEATLALFQPVAYEARRAIPGGARLTLFDAGHILGSSSALVEAAGGSILFSGDLGRRQTPILRDPNTAYPASTSVDHVVIESTYGDRLHPTGITSRERLREVLRRALDDGGKVLVPAFSIGRTQELIAHLRELYATGDFTGVPVVVDGPMGLDVTALYERHRDCYDAEAAALLRGGDGPLSFGELYGARGRQASERVRDITGPAIVIAGSGMCTGGRILGYLEEFLPDARTDVLFVGYQARGTMGRRLLEGADAVTIEGRSVNVRARVTELGGFSAHADRDGLLAWLRKVPGPPRGVFVGHGEPSAAAAFAERVGAELEITATVAEEGVRYELW